MFSSEGLINKDSINAPLEALRRHEMVLYFVVGDRVTLATGEQGIMHALHRQDNQSVNQVLGDPSLIHEGWDCGWFTVTRQFEVTYTSDTGVLASEFYGKYFPKPNHENTYGVLNDFVAKEGLVETTSG